MKEMQIVFKDMASTTCFEGIEAIFEDGMLKIQLKPDTTIWYAKSEIFKFTMKQLKENDK